jgi:hypothetical protein
MSEKPNRRDLLPGCVLEGAPEAVKEAEQSFRAALDAHAGARDDARKASEAAEAAPDADAQADLEAKRAGRKLPKPTLPDLERECDAAQRLVALAMTEAIAARDQRSDPFGDPLESSSEPSPGAGLGSADDSQGSIPLEVESSGGSGGCSVHRDGPRSGCRYCAGGRA